MTGLSNCEPKSTLLWGELFGERFQLYLVRRWAYKKTPWLTIISVFFIFQGCFACWKEKMHILRSWVVYAEAVSISETLQSYARNCELQLDDADVMKGGPLTSLLCMSGSGKTTITIQLQWMLVTQIWIASQQCNNVTKTCQLSNFSWADFHFFFCSLVGLHTQLLIQSSALIAIFFIADVTYYFVGSTSAILKEKYGQNFAEHHNLSEPFDALHNMTGSLPILSACPMSAT